MVRKILLVDPHEVYRRGLVKLLENVTDLMIVGHASTSGEAWSLLVQLQPDLVVVEMEL
ncbi:DNA-binding response regulator, partial [Halomonas sp. ND22Bw]